MAVVSAMWRSPRSGDDGGGTMIEDRLMRRWDIVGRHAGRLDRRRKDSWSFVVRRIDR